MNKYSYKIGDLSSLGEKSKDEMTVQEGLGYEFIIVNRPYLPPEEDRVEVFRKSNVDEAELKEWKQSDELTVKEIVEDDIVKKLKEFFD